MSPFGIIIYIIYILYWQVVQKLQVVLWFQKFKHSSEIRVYTVGINISIPNVIFYEARQTDPSKRYKYSTITYRNAKLNTFIIASKGSLTINIKNDEDFVIFFTASVVYMTSWTNNTQIQQEIVTYGPVTAFMYVYENFVGYKGGKVNILKVFFNYLYTKPTKISLWYFGQWSSNSVENVKCSAENQTFMFDERY